MTAYGLHRLFTAVASLRHLIVSFNAILMVVVIVQISRRVASVIWMYPPTNQ
jgi:hypothetical protein